MRGDISQKLLFEKLKNITGEKEFISQISNILSISTAGVYRRINAETLLTINEIIILSKYFNISYNKMFSYVPDNEVIFSFKYDKLKQNFVDYLNGITQNLNYIKSFEDHTMIYSAKDLPIWHYFGCDYLKVFKIYYLLRTIKKDPEFQNKKFEFDCVPEYYIEAANASFQAYSEINSEELWTPSSLNIILGQIKYYYQSGIISEYQFDIITDKLIELLDSIKIQASDGRKKKLLNSPQGSYKLFLSEIIGGDNVIYAEGGGNQITFHPPILMNYMQTKDIPFCNYIKNAFEIAKGTAELISTISERSRNMFFNDFAKKVVALKKCHAI
jgi:hypothetical protein